ncbi:14626_t:CDS:2, partial [Cetraspora pellucida]
NQIMHAEQMSEIPIDLEENWHVVVCPIGKRCIVISAKGKTVSRLRNGCELNRFESPLPAGSSSYKGNKTSDYCILDCIYDQTTFTYYVLDMMCWKGHPIYDCDTEFRFYWLNTKLAEMDAPSQNTSTYTFTPLAAYTCDIEQLSSLIPIPDTFGYRPDGLLFFNKHTQYVLGDTPLCGWHINSAKCRGLDYSFSSKIATPLLQNVCTS